MSGRLYIHRGGGASPDINEVTALTGRRGSPFFDGDLPLIQMGRRFADGEASQGYFLLNDPDAELPSDDMRLSPHALVTWTEDATGDELWLARSRIAQSESGRATTYIPGNRVEWQVTANDNNVDLNGQAFTEVWSRPAETDVERVLALAAYTLSGAASTSPHSRTTCDITVDTGHLVNDDTTTNMPAKDYPIGTQPSEVVQDCADTAGKLWGVSIHHEGGSHDCLQYIQELDHATYHSDAKISDHYADWDPNHATTPVWEPVWDMGKATIIDSDGVIHGLVSIWGGTDEDPQAVYVHQDADITPYEFWSDSNYDSESKNETQATARANALLEFRRPQRKTHRVSVKIRATQHHLLNAGMSIQIKAAAVAGGDDLGDYINRRIAELTWEPAPDGDLWAHMNLEKPVRKRIREGRRNRAQPAATSPKPAPEVIPQPEDTLTGIVSWSFDSDALDDATSLINSNVIFQAAGLGDAFDAMFDGGYGRCANGAGTTDFVACSDGPKNIAMDLAYKFANRGDIEVTWYDDAIGTVPLRTDTVVDDAGKATFTKYHISENFTPPAGTESFRIRWPTFAGTFVDNIVVSDFIEADEVENPPGAFDYGDCPHESGHFLPSDYLECKFGELQDQLNGLRHVAETDPTADDDADAGYPVGTIWINEDTGDVFVSVDDTDGAAVWEPLDGSSGGGSTLADHELHHRFIIVAHQGDINDTDGYPEGTLEAIRQAVQKGAHWVDLDLRKSSDGTWHVLHDSTLDRTTNLSGAISGKTDAAIAAGHIDGGNGYDSGRHGTSLKVPTLLQVVNALKPYPCVFQFDCKILDDDTAAELAQFAVDEGIDQRVAFNLDTDPRRAIVTAISPNIFIGGPDYGTADWDATTIDTFAEIAAFAPTWIIGVVDRADYPAADEAAILETLWDRGARGITANDIPATVAKLEELLHPAVGAHVDDTTDAHDASAISIADAGGYFTSTDTEGALQELGASAGSGGIGPILISDTPSTPLVFADLIQNEAQDDLVYADP